MKHFEYEINLLVDGELPDADKKEVFAHLAECEECRMLFTQYLSIKDKSADYCAHLIKGAKQEKKNPYAVKTGNIYKSAFYISSAAAILIAFFLFNRMPDTHYIKKNEVRVDTVFVPKEKQVIKYVNSAGKPEKRTPEEKTLKQQSYLSFVNGLRVEKITDADKI